MYRGLFSAAPQDRLGAAYWVRVVILLALIASVTWYAKQGTNNPFAFRRTIIVAGNAGAGWIHCHKKKNRAETGSFLLYLSPQTSVDVPVVMPPATTLITVRAGEEIYRSFQTPPARHIVLDTALALTNSAAHPPGWPEPTVTADRFDHPEIVVRRVYPFGDSLAAICLRYHAIEIMIFDGGQPALDTGASSVFRETPDIVIVNSSSGLPVLKLREMLRPRFMMVFPGGGLPDAAGAPENVVAPAAGDFAYCISRDAAGRVAMRRRK